MCCTINWGESRPSKGFLESPDGSELYLICRAFKKMPYEVEEEDSFMIKFLLEGLKLEKNIIDKNTPKI